MITKVDIVGLGAGGALLGNRRYTQLTSDRYDMEKQGGSLLAFEKSTGVFYELPIGVCIITRDCPPGSDNPPETLRRNAKPRDTKDDSK